MGVVSTLSVFVPLTISAVATLVQPLVSLVPPIQPPSLPQAAGRVLAAVGGLASSQ